MTLRRPVKAFVIAAIALVAIVLIAAIPGCSTIGLLLAPGYFSAAIIFPQGIEGDYGFVFLGLAALLDLNLAALIVWWILIFVEKRRKESL